MNDIKFVFDTEEYQFKLENYNQLMIKDFDLFSKIMIRFKEFENIKFDDYSLQLLSGSTYLNKLKLTKKNLIVIDLNDFSKIISTLSLEKNSISRMLYQKRFEEKFCENKYDDMVFEIHKSLNIDEEVGFVDKEPNIEKVIDLMFSLKYKKDQISNIKNLVNIINEYLKLNEQLHAIIIIDSSIKLFDYEKLLNKSNITIIDTCFDLNVHSESLIMFNNEITNISLENLITRIIFNWPEQINEKQVRILLLTYLRFILNEEIYLFDKPTDNLILIYVITRKLLDLNVEKNIISLTKTSKIIDFLEEIML